MTHSQPVSAIAALALAALLAGGAAAQDVDAGRATFISYCAACHGTSARGDGPMAPILEVLPADLTRLAADNGGVFPWARAARRIDGRDPFLAHGGPMPIFGEFFEGEPQAWTTLKLPNGQPMMTTRAIADLLVYLESLQELEG